MKLKRRHPDGYVCKIGTRVFQFRPYAPGAGGQGMPRIQPHARWIMSWALRGERDLCTGFFRTLTDAKEEATKQWLRWELGHPCIKECLVKCSDDHGLVRDPLAPSALADWCEEQGGKAAAWLRLVCVRGRNKRVKWPPGWEAVAARFPRE